MLRASRLDCTLWNEAGLGVFPFELMLRYFMMIKCCSIPTFFYLFIFLTVSSGNAFATCLGDTIVAECSEGECVKGFRAELFSGRIVSAMGEELRVITRAILNYNKYGTDFFGVYDYQDIDEKLCSLHSIPSKVNADTVSDVRKIWEMRAALPSKITMHSVQSIMLVIMIPIYVLLLINMQRRKMCFFRKRRGDAQGGAT